MCDSNILKQCKHFSLVSTKNLKFYFGPTSSYSLDDLFDPDFYEICIDHEHELSLQNVISFHYQTKTMVNESSAGNEEVSCERKKVYDEYISGSIFNAPAHELVCNDDLHVSIRSSVNRDIFSPDKLQMKSSKEGHVFAKESDNSRDINCFHEESLSNFSFEHVEFVADKLLMEERSEYPCISNFTESLINFETNTIPHLQTELWNIEMTAINGETDEIDNCVNDLDSVNESPKIESLDRNVELILSISDSSQCKSIITNNFDDSRMLTNANSQYITSINGSCSESESISTTWTSLLQSPDTLTSDQAESFLSSLKYVTDNFINDSSSMDAGIIIWGLNDPNSINDTVIRGYKQQMYSMNSLNDTGNGTSTHNSLDKKSGSNPKNVHNANVMLPVWVGGLRKVTSVFENVSTSCETDNVNPQKSSAEKSRPSKILDLKEVKSVLDDKILCKRCCPLDCFEVFENVCKRMRKI